MSLKSGTYMTKNGHSIYIEKTCIVCGPVVDESDFELTAEVSGIFFGFISKKNINRLYTLYYGPKGHLLEVCVKGKFKSFKRRTNPWIQQYDLSLGFLIKQENYNNAIKILENL